MRGKSIKSLNLCSFLCRQTYFHDTPAFRAFDGNALALGFFRIPYMRHGILANRTDVFLWFHNATPYISARENAGVIVPNLCFL